MNVRLTPHSEQLLRVYLAKGRYRTAEEAIERALENLGEKEPLRDRYTPSRATPGAVSSVLGCPR